MIFATLISSPTTTGLSFGVFITATKILFVNEISGAYISQIPNSEIFVRIPIPKFYFYKFKNGMAKPKS